MAGLTLDGAFAASHDLGGLGHVDVFDEAQHGHRPLSWGQRGECGQQVQALTGQKVGFLVGVLSGMFGVGGGFLTTPLLIFYGIPPTVAVASATTQITGASVSGAMVHMRRGGVDMNVHASGRRRGGAQLANVVDRSAQGSAAGGHHQRARIAP